MPSRDTEGIVREAERNKVGAQARSPHPVTPNEIVLARNRLALVYRPETKLASFYTNWA